MFVGRTSTATQATWQSTGPWPEESKHLRVLREVGLVHVRRDGRQMLYRTDTEAIRPLHEWTQTFERMWRHPLARIKEQAESQTEKR